MYDDCYNCNYKMNPREGKDNNSIYCAIYGDVAPHLPSYYWKGNRFGVEKVILSQRDENKKCDCWEKPFWEV